MTLVVPKTRKMMFSAGGNFLKNAEPVMKITAKSNHNMLKSGYRILPLLLVATIIKGAGTPNARG
jgi:hypothetical protein